MEWHSLLSTSLWSSSSKSTQTTTLHSSAGSPGYAKSDRGTIFTITFQHLRRLFLTLDDIAINRRFTLDAVRRPQRQNEGVQIVHLPVARNLGSVNSVLRAHPHSKARLIEPRVSIIYQISIIAFRILII